MIDDDTTDVKSSQNSDAEFLATTSPPEEHFHQYSEVLADPYDPSLDPTVKYLLGVRFHKTGQIYFFDAKKYLLRVGTKIIIDLEFGSMLGEIITVVPATDHTVQDESFAEGVILGIATAKDIAMHAENAILAAEAAAFCTTCIRQRSLNMKLVDVEVLHDRSKIIFFFTAPSRIDFRELVKDLVRTYRTRIELRQIGVRHEAQMIGGLGNCGLVCCCHSYLRKFAPVTIKMAKEQNLFLNPAKLSGLCGRLLCCLSFEQGNYEHFNQRSPKLWKRYVTPQGLLKVVRANMFSQTIHAVNEANEELVFTLDDWETLGAKRQDHQEEKKNAQDRSSFSREEIEQHEDMLEKHNSSLKDESDLSELLEDEADQEK